MTDFHTLTVGDIDCTIISDGSTTFGMDKMIQRRFPNVPEDVMLRALAEADIQPDAIPSHFNALLIRTGDELLLVDAGSGAGSGENTGYLLANMEAAGASPAEVTTVMISHLHGDHIGGLFTDDMAFVFPNARYFVAQQEWSYWADKELLQSMGDSGKMLFERMKRLEPQLKKIAPGTQISPGVRAVSAFGHTPGHMGVMVESEGTRLLHAVDILHSAVQFAHPQWSIEFDIDKTQARETRFKMLERAANEKLSLLLYHLPFPGLGTVQMEQEEEREWFVWMPNDETTAKGTAPHG